MAQVFFVVDRPNRVRNGFHHAVEGGFAVVESPDRRVGLVTGVVELLERVEIGLSETGRLAHPLVGFCANARNFWRET